MEIEKSVEKLEDYKIISQMITMKTRPGYLYWADLPFEMFMKNKIIHDFSKIKCIDTRQLLKFYMEEDIAKEEIFRIQIEETIKSHMIKQRQMIEKGVKVLSLFFIDKVANYVENDGIIKKLFDEAFDKLKKQYPYFASMKSEEVREGYFAKKTAKGKLDEFVDTSIEKKTQAERELEQAAYNLIMKEKEKLLNFELCFLLSDSNLIVTSSLFLSVIKFKVSIRVLEFIKNISESKNKTKGVITRDAPLFLATDG
jgi:hypothetical protein